MMESLSLWAGREDFVHLVGSNAIMAKGLLNGAVGVVPSAGNLVPELYKDVCGMAQRSEAENLKKVQEITNRASAVYVTNLTLGKSIAAIKYLASKKGLVSDKMLMPLSELSDDEKKLVDLAWTDFMEKWNNESMPVH